jgi:DNA-binding Xre family transcriptional regulator
LLEDAPDGLRRIKQKDIARYLGITPVALSRIRGKSKIQYLE